MQPEGLSVYSQGMEMHATVGTWVLSTRRQISSMQQLCNYIGK